MFPHIPLYQIEPIKPSVLQQEGATFGQAPMWDGTKYAPMNPVAWYNAGTLIGRVKEVNILGSGAFSTVVGDRANLTINAGAITVNGQAVTAINPGANMSASVLGGVATLNANANAYTHPTYSPQAFEPFVSSTQIGIPAIYTDSIGSVQNILMRTFNLPTSGGGTSGITINGAGPYTSILTGTGLTASGNVISATASGGGTTTLTHAGFGSPIFTGSAPSYMMKGIRSLSAGLSIIDTGQTIDLQLAGGSSTVNVYNSGGFIGAFPGINFQGFPSVYSSGGLAVVVAPTGGGGTSGVNVNSVGPYSNLTFTGAGVSVSGSTITIPGGSGGSAGIAILNQGNYFMPAVTTLDIWNGNLQNMGGGMTRLVLPSSGGGGITGIMVNYAGNYNNIVFTGGGVSVAGNTVTINGGSSGGYTHPSYAPRNVVPSLVGNQLTVHGFSSDVEGHIYGVSTVTMTLPTGGGSTGVTSLSSGAPSVLSVSPSSGTVTITPTGTTTSFTPYLSGSTLALPNFTVTSGITTGIGTTFINLPTGSSGLTGTSGNGLSVTSNTVSLALANGVNGGAMPALSGYASNYLGGNGTWLPNGIRVGATMAGEQSGDSTYTNILTLHAESLQVGVSVRVIGAGSFAIGLRRVATLSPGATDLTSAITLVNEIRNGLIVSKLFG